MLIRRIMTRSYFYQKNMAGTDARYTRFQQRGPLGGMLHSLGCTKPDAKSCADYWDREDFTAASVHAFIDANTGAVYQTMPWNFRAPHCGGSYNDSHIGIEMCEPPSDVIRYVDPDHSAKIVVLDRERALQYVNRTYAAAVDQFADLAIQFGWDPLAHGVIVSHSEGYRMGVASNHADPEHLWTQLGTGYTMDGFRRDVDAAVKRKQAPDPLIHHKPSGDVHSDYADAAVKWAKDSKLILGDGKGNYDWQQRVSREDAATILYRYACLGGELPADRADLTRFADIRQVSEYALLPLSWAVSLGIIKGVSPTALEPRSACSRGQLVAILHRLYGEPAAPVDVFSDVPGSSYYAQAIGWASSEGLVQGIGSGLFDPNGDITREQLVTILYRIKH